MINGQLISSAYLKEQEILHLDPDYGCASVTYAPIISQILNKTKMTQLLDYGAGKARLMHALKVDHELQIQCYDPAIPGFSKPPVPMQFVACVDVLEHIEPEYLDGVLDDLERVTEGIGFFTVSTVPAEKTLSDGRNAHLIQEPVEWWWPKITSRFDLQTLQVFDGGFYVIVFAKPKIIEGVH